MGVDPCGLTIEELSDAARLAPDVLEEALRVLDLHCAWGSRQHARGDRHHPSAKVP